MCSEDWLDSPYLYRGVVHSVDPSDLIQALLRRRVQAIANELHPSLHLNIKISRILINLTVNLLQRHTFCGIIE